ncbi:DUF4340 domain-containing protein [Nibricoccus sp. IMCC34717]|uniref:DUF4340 domain-containing protein n=1 Tax=Nibricoccus sp. IMCC34717 TaxID=3034021 RepID=UPI00384AC3B4
MKLKPLVLTVAALAAAAAATHWLTRTPPLPSADPRLGQPVLATDTVEQATQLTVAQAGKSVALTRQPDGSWVVTSYHDLPADISRLSQLADSLTSAKWQRFVTANPDRLKRLDLDNLRVTFTDAKSTATELQIGKSFEGGGRFARLGTEPKAFVADLSVWVDPEPKSWADTHLLNLKPEDIAELTVSFAEGDPLTFRREKPDAEFTATNAPDGKRLKASQVTSAVSALANLRWSDTRSPDDAAVTAAAPHSRRLTAKTFAGRTLACAFSQKPKEATPPAPSQTPPSGAEQPQPAPPTPTPAPPQPDNPVFVQITDADTASPLNALMARRSFEVYPYLLTSLPPDRTAWLEDAKN